VLVWAGIYKYEGPYRAYIDVKNIAELKKTILSSTNVIVGASVTLTSLIELLTKAAEEMDAFKYAGDMATHLMRAGSTPIRNASLKKVIKVD